MSSRRRCPNHGRRSSSRVPTSSCTLSLPVSTGRVQSESRTAGAVDFPPAGPGPRYRARRGRGGGMPLRPPGSDPGSSHPGSHAVADYQIICAHSPHSKKRPGSEHFLLAGMFPGLPRAAWRHSVLSFKFVVNMMHNGPGWERRKGHATVFLDRGQV